MKDRFENRSADITGPIVDGFEITPNDSLEFSEITRAIYVGASGDVCLITESSTELVFKNLAAGTILPARAKIVKAAGTTASNLLGLV